ncbi:MAG: hypothetical protein C5B50_24050 [Verrucomicrobia bacterium]|nr:MAG: hypothetical protein C5B50_24050 [Verrucomicrobiota bacterium]
MSTAAILSIKPIYANQILAGSKTIELRKSSMGLRAGDVILVYSSAPEQKLSFWFRIECVEKLPVREMWSKHHQTLGINEEDYLAYFLDVPLAVGFHVGAVHPLRPIHLAEVEELVPGFVPPQGIIWLKDELGRFRNLLARLSPALPDDVFSQQSLSLGV